MATKTSWFTQLERVVLALALIVVGIWLVQQMNWLDILPELISFWQWGQSGFSLVGTSIHSLILPSTTGLAIAFLIIQLFPASPPVWARATVSGILLLLGLRYIIWRLFVTLNLSDLLNGSLSLLLFAIEVLSFVTNLGSIVQMNCPTNRTPEADRMSKAVIKGTYCPWVDVLVPTYNEPVELLRRTIIGCQAMDYAYKRIYLLDDQRRPAMRSLAHELGCLYISRPDNRHAKAGNINNALKQMNGELVVVFDADFIPTRNFLTRTVGFFQNSQVALLQTPQTFYNSDPIANNLGLESIVANEQDMFFRVLQPGRDAINAAICCGTSFVVRRKILEKIGGIPTESIAEDLMTSLKIQADGYRVLYLNEALSAGAAAENVGGYIDQRSRWGQGTLQTLFCKTNSLIIPGLNLGQRLYYALGILFWPLAGLQFVILLMPLAYLMFGLAPLQVEVNEMLFFWLPYYLVSLVVFAWLNGRTRSVFWADVYTTLICFPLALMVIKTFISPFGKGFKVTPKGVSSQGINLNWQVAAPLFVVLALYILAIGMHLFGLQRATNPDSLALNLFWAIYNLCVLVLTIQVAIDVPQQVLSLDFPHQLSCQLCLDAQQFEGITVNLSEKRTRSKFTSSVLSAQLPNTGFLHIPSISLFNLPVVLKTKMSTVKNAAEPHFGDTSELELEFTNLDLKQERQLVEFLFCQPGQWQKLHISETKSLWSFLSSVFRLYSLTETTGVNSNASSS